MRSLLSKVPLENRQKGAVMITSLVLLVVLTIAISANTNNILIEEKVVANQRDRFVAMEAAESSLREAELWMKDRVAEPSNAADGSADIWATNGPSDESEWWLENDSDWWTTKATKANFSAATEKPYYVIEDYAYVQDSLVTGQQKDERGRNFYRITARGTGGTNTARVILQTTFTKRF